jgi:hypothetical protein
MTDDTMFERRLASALGQFADLAPTMDDEVVARTAIRVGGLRRQGWLGRFTRSLDVLGTPGHGMRLAYALVLLALLFAALLAAVAGGFFRVESPFVPGHNDPIIYSVGPNGHRPITNVAIGPDGGGAHDVEAGRCPAYSRDGTALAWLSYEDAGAFLNVVGADGLAPPKKLLLLESAQQSVPFELSPDGTRVVWVRPAPDDPSRSELWVSPVDGSPGARVVPASTVPGEAYGSPAWSPDGRLIAFAVYVKEIGTGQTRRTAIDIASADGSGRQRATSRPGPVDVFAWSPDSRSLAYIGSPDGAGPTAQDVFVIGADGTADQDLTASPAREGAPAWSPDGEVIAFQTFDDDSFARLTTLGVAGTPGRSVIGPATEWFVWSPDGHELLWSEVLAVDAETNRTTLYSIDRGFQEPPRTLQVVDGLIVCTPSWQRLEG